MNAPSKLPETRDLALRPLGRVEGDDPKDLLRRLRMARDLALSRAAQTEGPRHQINWLMAEAANSFTFDTAAPPDLLKDVLALCMVLNRADALAEGLDRYGR